MKKLFAMILALVMVLSLAACGGSSAPAATEAPATEAPATQAPATEPAAKKGCGSAVATTAVVVGLVATLGTALVVKKRD
jgi:predicted small lipoprotein YifL